MLPRTIVIDCTKELRRFMNVVCRQSLPTVDIAAAVSQIFDAIRHLDFIDQRLEETAKYMSAGEGLFENIDKLSTDSYLVEEIAHAVKVLGIAIKNQLEHFGLYQGSITPYIFRNIINDHTIILLQETPKLATYG